MAAIPEFNLTLLPPAVMSIDLLGTSIESDRSMSGLGGAIDYSGGGYWMAKYKKLQIYKPESHRYWNQLRNQLNGGVRTIIVPLLTDWIAPVASRADPVITKAPFSDQATFSDNTSFRQSSIVASLAGDAALNAGTVKIVVAAGGALYGGEVFAINHPGKGWRSYGISDVDSVAVDDNGTPTYTVGIRPTLRAAVEAATSVEFARPRCTMRLMSGTTLSWDVQTYWQSTPDIEFIEAL